jgi:general secretion pathway protein J
MIEVLVAIALLSGLTAIVWASINNMFRTRDFVKKRQERYQIVRVALDRMSSELASAYVAGPAHGAEKRFQDRQQSSGGGGQDQQQAQQARNNTKQQREPVQFGMIGRDDRLDFTSFAHMRNVRDERTSYHAEIGYAIKEVRNEQGDLVDSLVRREDTTIDDDITQGGKVYTLIPNIEEIEFEYWDPGEVDLGTEEEMGRGQWVDSWDTENREYHDRLPHRVRITITLPPQGPMGQEEEFTTQTQIMTHQMLDL